MNDTASDISSVHDVTRQVLETLDTLRERLVAAQVPDDHQQAQEQLPVTFDALRDTHADLLNLASYLRAALDDLDALETTDEAVMGKDEMDDLSEEMDDLNTRIDELMNELRNRRSRGPSAGENSR